MDRTTARRAAKPRLCEACGDDIEPGDIYVEDVLSPGYDDLGNDDWLRSIHCAGCARAFGHGDLIDARADA